MDFATRIHELLSELLTATVRSSSGCTVWMSFNSRILWQVGSDVAVGASTELVLPADFLQVWEKRVSCRKQRHTLVFRDTRLMLEFASGFLVDFGQRSSTKTAGNYSALGAASRCDLLPAMDAWTTTMKTV